MTTYSKYARPYCLFTRQLLWGYDDDYGQFIDDNFIQERFCRKFCRKPLLSPIVYH